MTSPHRRLLQFANRVFATTKMSQSNTPKPAYAFTTSAVRPEHIGSMFQSNTSARDYMCTKMHFRDEYIFMSSYWTSYLNETSPISKAVKFNKTPGDGQNVFMVIFDNTIANWLVAPSQQTKDAVKVCYSGWEKHTDLSAVAEACPRTNTYLTNTKEAVALMLGIRLEDKFHMIASTVFATQQSLSKPLPELVTRLESNYAKYVSKEECDKLRTLE